MGCYTVSGAGDTKDLLATVVSVLHPIIDVNLGHATNQELKLTLIKDIDEFLRNELVEARHEGVELLRNAARDTVLGDESECQSTDAGKSRPTRRIRPCCPR